MVPVPLPALLLLLQAHFVLELDLASRAEDLPVVPAHWRVVWAVALMAVALMATAMTAVIAPEPLSDYHQMDVATLHLSLQSLRMAAPRFAKVSAPVGVMEFAAETALD